MTEKPSPPVLRSWQHLLETRPDIPPPETLPLESSGTTYVMAQELTWLDANHFAVGRWDGSMSVFRFTDAPTKGSLITTAVNTPAAEGVQMITALRPDLFATSNDNSSIALWRSDSGQWNDLKLHQLLNHSAALGVANSGTAFARANDNSLFLVVGHSNGFVTVWHTMTDSDFRLVTEVDVRSARPLNPWCIHNVRGLCLAGQDNDHGYVISGSEDGDLCVIRITDGKILSRRPYNPKAMRGINSIAAYGEMLLVANCAVGLDDRNLWSYRIKSADWSLEPSASINLRVDKNRPQVFNFDVIIGNSTSGVRWFASTEEGFVWMGDLSETNDFRVMGRQNVSGTLGAALGLSTTGNFAVAAYDLYEFAAPSV